MYGFGQIIYDKDNKQPVIIDDVWDISQYPKRHTHLEARDGDVWTGPFTFEDPHSRAEWLAIAHLMLARGDLKPAETPKTHCPDCGNWLTNKPKDWCAEAKHADTYAALRAKRCAQ